MPQKGSYEHRAQSLEDRRGEVVAPFVGPESRLQSKRFACSFEHLSKCWSTSTQKVHVNTYIGGLYQATLVGMDMPPIHPPIHPPPSTYPSTYPSTLPYLPTLPTYLPTYLLSLLYSGGCGDGTWGAGMGHGGQAPVPACYHAHCNHCNRCNPEPDTRPPRTGPIPRGLPVKYYYHTEMWVC